MTFREIGARLDPVTPPRSLRELWGLHRWHDRREPSLRRITDRWTHPGRIEQRFLNQNTWLMDIKGIPKAIAAAHKPATMSRASALGRFVSENYDLVLLQEVWEERHRRRLLDDWGSPEPSWAVGVEGHGVHRAGVSATGGAALDPLGDLENVIGAGLMMISRDAVLEDVTRRSFEHQGSFPALDVFAEKGILKATVRLGSDRGTSMTLELFTAHLAAIGGDEGAAIRTHQIDALCAFVGEPRDDAVRIVAGDFNVTPDSAPGAHLFTSMQDLGFEEITATEGWRDRIPADFHTTIDEQKLWAADCVWPPEALGSPYVERTPTLPEAETTRLDYCFIDRPRPEHRFDLDFTRPRRVRIRRSRAARDAVLAPLASDHLGIATTLLLTPR